MVKYNPLFDIDFLNELTLKRDRIVYARITALTKDELPIEAIDGKVTGGSINIDGASAVRRTCSLTMVAQDININDFYWGLKNKFTLEIGIKNTINSKYPDIIWFKQGLFIITNFTTSQSANNYTINISGKDKMCLLNGEIGGSLPHSTNFGVEEIVDLETDTYIQNDIPIKTIIREAVQTFGGELAHNIIINDLDEMGLDLVEYRGETPLYLKRKAQDKDIKNFINMTLDGEQECWIGDEKVTLSDESIIYDSLSALMSYAPTEVSSVANGSLKYCIAKLEYGDNAGYRVTDLTYPGDLISNIGESVTSMLDKIKTMLDNFEYFYDINGKFVFQRKKNYVISPWGGGEKTEEIKIELDPSVDNSIFNFTNGHLISSFSNSPNLLNLRNDFVVWGKSSTTSGQEIPIHMRYVIDDKPTQYKPIRPLKRIIKHYKNNILESEDTTYFDAFGIEPYDNSQLEEVIEIGDRYVVDYDVHQFETYYYYAKEPYTSDDCDWRELIYQMALDYRKLGHTDDFLYDLYQANPHFINGKTGYEQYYIDLEGFWRELYNPNPEGEYVDVVQEDAQNIGANLYLSAFTKCDKSTIDLTKVENYDDYYVVYSAPYIADEKSEPVLYKAIYPFTEGYCHLDEDKVYYILDEDNILRSISGEDNLKDKSLENLKVKDGDSYTPFIEYCFKQVVKSKTVNLYQKSEYVLHSALETELSEFYKDYPSSLMRLKLNNFGKNSDLTSVSTIDISYYEKYYEYYNNEQDEFRYWRKDAIEHPESLIFWFDFLEPYGTDLAKYGVPTIGDRPKVVNNDKVKSIYYREIPNIIFSSTSTDEKESGYSYIQIQPNMETLFNISSKGKSAKENIDELLYNHLYCTESVNISSVPVYHLEPNSRVYIQDEISKIQGEYLISKITIPLMYNGMMTLTGVKVPPESVT